MSTTPESAPSPGPTDPPKSSKISCDDFGHRLKKVKRVVGDQNETWWECVECDYGTKLITDKLGHPIFHD